MIQSPLNYTGGKYRLLPQIIPLFPQNVRNFVDLFCGGGDVGSNVQCESVYFNDINTNVVGILRAFQALDKDDTLQTINDTIEQFQLSNVSERGYAFYNCDSSKGLGSYNRQPYNNLRAHFNQLQEHDSQYYLSLYVLMVYSFNNQIRFNSRGEFNLPVGKRDFNSRMQTKLCAFVDRLKEIDCNFSNEDFRDLPLEELGEDDFVYADPPYLITCATYNERGGWNEELEISLYNYLDNLHLRNIRFALSNVLTGKGRENTILREWLSDNPEYTCHHLNYRYSNSNYHLIDRNALTDEVLVTNY